MEFGILRDCKVTKEERAEDMRMNKGLKFVQTITVMTAYLKLILYGSMLNKFRWYGLWEGTSDEAAIIAGAFCMFCIVFSLFVYFG